jgi:hypothetical protein
VLPFGYSFPVDEPAPIRASSFQQQATGSLETGITKNNDWEITTAAEAEDTMVNCMQWGNRCYTPVFPISG